MLALTIIVLLIFGVGILRVLAKIFLGALSLTLSAATFIFKIFCIFFGILAGVIFLILQKLVPFAIKHLSTAVMWIIAAIVTLGLTIYAAGRNIFYGESILDFIKKLIPHKEISSRRTDFLLLLIELADSIQSEISEELKSQYEQVLSFFKNPLNVNNDE